MNLSPEQLVVGLGAVLAAWYLLASIYNRRRGLAAYRWLRDGLDVIGDRHEGKWLGSAASGAHLIVAKAKPPFRRVEVIFILESRELLPLWIVDLLRDKRDQVIFKATVRASRQAELEIAPVSGRIARRIRSRVDNTWEQSEMGGMLVAHRGRDASPVLEMLKPILNAYGSQLRHISWATSKPNLIAILNLPELLKSGDNATDLFTCIRDAATSGQ